MVSILGLYCVIARDDCARFVRPAPHNGLHTISFVDLATVQRNATDSSAPRGPPGMERHCFLPPLARRIGEDFAVDLFTHLVLVAPPHVLQELTTLNDVPTGTSLLGTLARDLITVPDLELWPHMLPWIQAATMTCAPGVASRK